MLPQIQQLKSRYCGFHISEPIGNNAFSFDKRQTKKIYVPPLVSGTLADLAVGSGIVFVEFEDEEEKGHAGLKNLVHCEIAGKNIFIFDNHNHAFVFWLAAFQAGLFEKETTLVHVDQHSDMREPESYPQILDAQRLPLESAFRYANFHLNVGNFIQPALRLGLFSEVEIITGGSDLEKNFNNQYILDVDIDFFADEMAYVREGFKIEGIRNYVAGAQVVTVATSPFFMDQEKAIKIIRKIFSRDDEKNHAKAIKF